MLRGSKVKINQNSKLNHLRGMLGIVIDVNDRSPDAKGILLKPTKWCPCYTVLYFPEKELDLVEGPVEV